MNKTCAWCDQPAVTKVQLEPERWGNVYDPGQQRVRKTLLRQAIVADVCAQHAATRDRPRGKQIADPRRKRATVVQLDIYGREVTR